MLLILSMIINKLIISIIINKLILSIIINMAYPAGDPVVVNARVPGAAVGQASYLYLPAARAGQHQTALRSPCL